jgi:hypothetical protein
MKDITYCTHHVEIIEPDRIRDKFRITYRKEDNRKPKTELEGQICSLGKRN